MTKKIVLGGTLATAALLNIAAQAQSPGAPDKLNAIIFSSGANSQEAGSALDCKRPEQAKEAKVIDFDPKTSVARLAVNLGSGRFTLVTIRAWDQSGDPRPLNPVLEAAKITQGKLQFFSRQISSDPASAPDEYLIMTEMGGGYVCWAKPRWMMDGGNAPVAEAPALSKPAVAPAVVTPTSAVGINAPTAPAPGVEPGFRRITPARRATSQEAVTQ